MDDSTLDLVGLEVQDGQEIVDGEAASAESVKKTVIDAINSIKTSGLSTEDEVEIECQIATKLKKLLDERHTVKNSGQRWSVMFGRSFSFIGELPENTIRFSYYTKKYNIYMYRFKVQ
jgi:hypothetical protein